MVAFYNQEDQDIYTGGDHFIPQQYYRLGNFNTTVPTTETQQVDQGYGIPYTGAFTNSNINRDNPNTGGYGTWGNLDQSTGKTFKIGDRFVTGYKNLNTGLYQDYAGLNIQNLGLFKDEEDAEYPGLFHDVSFKSILKNPGIVKQYFERQDFKKQADLQKQLNLENKMAADQARREKTLAESGQVIHDLGPASTGTGTWHEQTAAKEKAGTQVAGPGFGDGAYFADGGRIGFEKGGWSPGVGRDAKGYQSGHGSYSGGKGHADKGWQTYAIGPTPDTTSGRTKKKIKIDPFVNLEKRSDIFSDDTEVPVDIGLMARINKAKVRANLNLRGLYDSEAEEINSLSDLKNQIEPSLSFNTPVGPFNVNAYKDKNIDAYGLRTNIGPLNLGYHDINSQKRGDISYANDKFNVGATTDFDNINFGIGYNEGPFSIGGTLDDEGKYNVGAELKYTFNNGGLARLL